SAELPLQNGPSLGTHNSNDYNNAISWDPSTWATGYRVERSIDGGAWKKIADVSGQNTTTYTDDSDADMGAVPTEATADPTLQPCPGSQITGIKIKVIISKGKVDKNGCSDDGSNTCATAATRPLDLGLPGLSLSTTDPDHANSLADENSGGMVAK